MGGAGIRQTIVQKPTLVLEHARSTTSVLEDSVAPLAGDSGQPYDRSTPPEGPTEQTFCKVLCLQDPVKYLRVLTWT